ncbi:MAG: DUF4339 domain-containing protein [Bacteriovoracaceae bacterium]|jgi:hypothetical protein|nr:DUF4339 domain-containing protein [Bacteriovoracaceae bacterium]
MSSNWYYVESGQRVGPVSEEELISFINSSRLGVDDYVWTKGFENWSKIKDIEKFYQLISGESSYQSENSSLQVDSDYPVDTDSAEEFDWNSVDKEEKKFFVLTGKDRGTSGSHYGPYSLSLLVDLFEKSRVNGKTFVWCRGLSNWTMLADVPIYKSLFQKDPPEVDDSDRREYPRRPFVARLFFHDNEKLFEGLCRDVSIGGMQILVNQFPGKAGDKISVNVHPENSNFHFVASGEVVRLLDGNQGFSFRFINLGEESLNVIRSYIYGEDQS